MFYLSIPPDQRKWKDSSQEPPVELEALLRFAFCAILALPNLLTGKLFIENSKSLFFPF